MAFSTFSSINNFIKIGNSTAITTPSTDNMPVLLKFDSGDISGSTLTNYGTAGNCTLDTSESYSLTISTSNQKVGTGCLNTGGTTNNNYNLISIPSFTLSGAISVCFWCYINSSVFNPRIIQFNCAGTSNICIRYLNQLYFDVLDAGSAVAPLSTNAWQHVVCMYSYSTGYKTIYINNIQKFNGTSNSNFGTMNGSVSSMYICPATNYNIDGYIDDLRVYSRILTSAEISNIYNNKT